MRHEIRYGARVALVERRIPHEEVLREIGAMVLHVSREIRAQHRDPERATELAREVDQPRRLLRLARLEAAERRVVDRREKQPHRGATNDERDARIALAGGGGEMAEDPHGHAERDDAGNDQIARVDQRNLPAQQTPTHHGHHRRGEPAGQHREPRLGGREAENALRKEREEKGAPIQSEAENHEEKDRRGEIAIVQHAEVDDRMLVARGKLPPHHRDETERRDDGELEDQVVGEPVIAVPFLEHVLERADADDEQPDTEPVNGIHAARAFRVLQE